MKAKKVNSFHCKFALQSIYSEMIFFKTERKLPRIHKHFYSCIRGKISW